jgi:hypothetical protein
MKKILIFSHLFLNFLYIKKEKIKIIYKVKFSLLKLLNFFLFFFIVLPKFIEYSFYLLISVKNSF